LVLNILKVWPLLAALIAGMDSLRWPGII